MLEKLKIKPLTKEQIIISLDRLTRFKYTEEKYLRVFKDIITTNLIYPKFKKKELDRMDYSELTYLVENVLDFSLERFKIAKTRDFTINKLLLNYEKTVFRFDRNVENLINNKIDYKACVKLLCDKDIPLNLKWLKTLAYNPDQPKNRASSGLKFPINKVVIVEGITEEILLPEFAKICGHDFNKYGIHVISAGGKNQVVKSFYQFVDILKLPIFVLLDNDAKDNFEEIKPKLRKNDEVYVLKSGEFEDILPINLIKRTLNKKYGEYFSVKLDDLRQASRMTHILSELLKIHGLEFKKAEFAQMVKQNIITDKDVSEEIKTCVLNMING